MTNAPALRIENMNVTYPGASSPALSLDAWQVLPGTLCAVAGPNGAGKSTLLKAAMGLTPAQGTAAFFGLPLSAARRRVAYMPQRSEVDWQFPIRVADVVAMGLYPRLGLLARLRRDDRALINDILSRVGMQDFAATPLHALSGGQQQRVFLGRALAQDADLLLMDEPMSGIDARTQDICLGVFKQLKDGGKSLVVVHHDLATVTRHFDTALLLNRHVIASGPAAEVMTAANIQTAYGIHDFNLAVS